MNSHNLQNTTRPALRRLNWLVLTSTLIALAVSSTWARDLRSRLRGANNYQQTNLVSDLPGIAAIQDVNLVNAWGISFGPTGPFWVSATERGRSMVYTVTNDSAGVTHVVKQPLEVTIPGEGNVTGQVFNNTTGFNGNLFIFVSEDGTISGWRPSLGTVAETLTNRTGAVYKGVTVIVTAHGPLLLAANFSEATLDAYDTNLVLLGQFSDRRAPAGYAPFNVQRVAGHIFVTFAKQDADKEDDVPGRGHGLIDVFDWRTGHFHRFATGSDAGGQLRALNSPWGVALAPRNFGRHGDELLVGNFGSGTIMTFEADGDFKGFLLGIDDHPIVIDGLWALTFGNGANAGEAGTLYFTAGPEDESHGLFGSLEPVRLHHRGPNPNGNDDDDEDGDGPGHGRHH
jgi:uncharacterized protein (TIGR03118 family)